MKIGLQDFILNLDAPFGTSQNRLKIDLPILMLIYE